MAHDNLYKSIKESMEKEEWEHFIKNTNTFGMFDDEGKAIPVRQAYNVGDIVAFHDSYMTCPNMMVTDVTDTHLTVTWFGHPETMFNYGNTLTRQILRLPRNCFRLVRRVRE